MSRRTRTQRDNPPTPRAAGTDSRPGTFVGGAALDTGDQDKWLSWQPLLETLDVATAKICMQETLRGAYARTQWIYELLEPGDGLLSACVRRRNAALGRIPWTIRLRPDLADEDGNLADRQMAVATDFFNSMTGLNKSITALGQAEFRGYKILQKSVTARGDLCLEITDNWNWVRDGYKGAWSWNPRAAYGTNNGDYVPVERCNLVIRQCGLPIDHVAMFNVLGRKNTIGQWRVYNGTYGVPVIMLYMPEGISPDERSKFIEVAKRITSSGRGVLPAGSKTEMLACTANNFESFARLLDQDKQELVLAATGGLLTMLAESGSGTLAGSAHQDAFDQLADLEAEEISEVINNQVTADVLDDYFPGEDHLVEFVLQRPTTEGADKSITDIATLSTAGYRVSVDTVQERTGYEVTEGVNPSEIYATKAAGYYPTQPAMEQITGMPLNPIPTEQMSTNRADVPEATQDTLTAQEIAALEQMAAGATLEAITAKTAAVLDDALQMAAGEPSTPETDANTKTPRHPVATPLQIANKPDYTT